MALCGGRALNGRVVPVAGSVCSFPQRVSGGWHDESRRVDRSGYGKGQERVKDESVE